MIEYVVDDKGIFVEDPISFDNIPKEYAISFHGKIYDIHTLYHWIVILKKEMCPMRNLITQNDINELMAKYNQLYPSKSKINNIFYDVDEKCVYFSDRIDNDDIWILKDGRQLYVYGTYLCNKPYYYVLAKDCMSKNYASYLDLKDIVAYIKK